MRLIEGFDINHNAVIVEEFQWGDEPQGFVGSNTFVDELMVQGSQDDGIGFFNLPEDWCQVILYCTLTITFTTLGFTGKTAYASFKV